MPRIPTWSETIEAHAPLLLPAAHDALTAKLIRRAGYPALQIGGFALEASRLGFPDIDLAQPGEMILWASDIIRAAKLPVLVDASNGGVDIKSTVRAALGFEAAGASALFLEDQASPKKCGHMGGKRLLAPARAAGRLRAVRELLHKDTFLLARTDAYEGEGREGVFRRGLAYLDAGADGLYFEGVDDKDDLEWLAREFSGRKLAFSLLEGGGKTPWITPSEAAGMGFSMILYPTSLLFRAISAIELGLVDLRLGEPMRDRGVSLEWFLDAVDIDFWRAIEAREC